MHIKSQRLTNLIRWIGLRVPTYHEMDRILGTNATNQCSEAESSILSTKMICFFT